MTDSLLTRLAQANMGSRELDIAVTMAVHGGAVQAFAAARGAAGQSPVGKDFRPTRSLDDAFALIDWSKVTLCDIRYRPNDEAWSVVLYCDWPRGLAATIKPTSALALAEAWIMCLRAREEEGKR